MKYIEDQSLHCTLKLGIWRVPFDGLESSPDDVINGSLQILKVFNEELRGISSILGQWLHHTEHLTHIRFSLLKDALNSFTMKLTAMLVEIARSGQTSELNDVKGFGFVMNISSHPLQDPSLRISSIPTDVKCGIELEQQLFIPMLLVSDEWQ